MNDIHTPYMCVFLWAEIITCQIKSNLVQQINRGWQHLSGIFHAIIYELKERPFMKSKYIKQHACARFGNSLQRPHCLRIHRMAYCSAFNIWIFTVVQWSRKNFPGSSRPVPIEKQFYVLRHCRWSHMIKLSSSHFHTLPEQRPDGVNKLIKAIGLLEKRSDSHTHLIVQSCLIV